MRRSIQALFQPFLKIGRRCGSAAYEEGWADKGRHVSVSMRKRSACVRASRQGASGFMGETGRLNGQSVGLMMLRSLRHLLRCGFGFLTSGK